MELERAVSRSDLAVRVERVESPPVREQYRAPAEARSLDQHARAHGLPPRSQVAAAPVDGFLPSMSFSSADFE